jgi:hypothetical protein
LWQCQADWCSDEHHDVVSDERCVTPTAGILTRQWLTQDNVARIESSGSHVYWVAEKYGKSYLRRVPFGGGQVEQIHEGAGRLMAVDGDVVYEIIDNRLIKVDVAGGCPANVVDLGPGSWSQILVDADNVYVLDWPNRVVRVAKMTAAVAELTPAVPYLFYLTVSGGYLYFARDNDIARYPVAGGNVETIATTGMVERLLVDSDHVFWIAPDGDAPGSRALYRVPVGGGTPSTLFTSSMSIWAMAADARFLYVAQSGPCGCGVCDGVILRVPKSGGAATVLVGGQDHIGSVELAVENGAIAWLTSQNYSQFWSATLP